MCPSRGTPLGTPSTHTSYRRDRLERQPLNSHQNNPDPNGRDFL